MNKRLKKLWILLGIIPLAVILLFVWLIVTEYTPESVENIDIARSGSEEALSIGTEYTVLQWNTGYAGLGAESDFFMDGGSDVLVDSEETVQRYLDGILQTIDENSPDILLLQEVDSDSRRSHNIDQRSFYSEYATSSVYALNHCCTFVPYPLPMLGKVNAGLYTATNGLTIESAERIASPCPFSWPVSMVNLKRCLLVSYMPIEGSDRKLVLVNLHLEAYDNGEGKIAQAKQLIEFITSEYEKGNYVIAGGDFNQVLPGTTEKYPITLPELWMPGVFDSDALPEGWSLTYSEDVPSCRLLNQPYDPEDKVNTQYYIIDGVITSPNVKLISEETLDEEFENSDHNPLKYSFVLLEED